MGKRIFSYQCSSVIDSAELALKALNKEAEDYFFIYNEFYTKEFLESIELNDNLLLDKLETIDSKEFFNAFVGDYSSNIYIHDGSKVATEENEELELSDG